MKRFDPAYEFERDCKKPTKGSAPGYATRHSLIKTKTLATTSSV